MSAVHQAIAELTKHRRSSYLFDTKLVAAAFRVHPNKFGSWWYSTRDKLKLLYRAQPGELCAEFAALLAECEADRQLEQRAAGRSAG